MQKPTAAEILAELEGRPHAGELSSNVKEQSVQMVVKILNADGAEGIKVLDEAIEDARICGDVQIASLLISIKNIYQEKLATAKRIADLGGAKEVDPTDEE